MTELSRRSFLSPSSYLPKEEPTRTQSDTEISPVYDNETIDAEVSKAIEQYLGLSQKDVECFIRPGNHVLDKNHIELIKSKKINHVMGEISLASLSRILLYDTDYTAPLSLKLKNLLNRVLSPGIGAADIERRYHKEALKALLENNFTISTADSDADQLWISKKETPNLVFYSGMGILSALLGISALAKSKNKVSRRKFLSIISGVSGAAALAGIEEWLRALTVPSPIPLRRTPIFEHGTDAQIALEKTGFMGDDLDETLGTFTELLVDRRNEIMALNYWYNIAATSNADSDEQNRILAYMGVGHGKAVDNFLEGPSVLEKKVYNFAEAILTDGLDTSLQTMLNDSTIDDGIYIFNGKLTVLGWSAFFEDAVSIGKNVPEGIDDDSRMPSTARAIFIDALLDQLEKLSIDHNSELNELKFQVLQAAAADLTQNMELTARDTIPSIRESVEIKHTVVDARSITDELKIVGMSDKITEAFNIGQGEMIDGVLHLRDTQIAESHSTTKPHEIGIGLAKYRGRYEPVTLRFFGNELSGTFYASKQIKSVYGYEQNIQTLKYRKVIDNDQLNSLANSPYLRADIIHDPDSWVSYFYRTGLTVVSLHTLPAFGYSDLYMLDGEPPTMYDPRIISSRQI